LPYIKCSYFIIKLILILKFKAAVGVHTVGFKPLHAAVGVLPTVLLAAAGVSPAVNGS